MHLKRLGWVFDGRDLYVFPSLGRGNKSSQLKHAHSLSIYSGGVSTCLMAFSLSPTSCLLLRILSDVMTLDSRLFSAWKWGLKTINSKVPLNLTISPGCLVLPPKF